MSTHQHSSYISIGRKPTDRDRRVLEILDMDDRNFNRSVADFIDEDSGVITAVIQKASEKFGCKIPSTWTYGDVITNARTSMYWVIKSLRDTTKTVNMPNGIDSYLVQWTNPKLAKEMEQELPDGASQANRNRTSIGKVQAELTTKLGREATVTEAVDHVNRERSIVRGILPAARHELIARPEDLTGDSRESDRARDRFQREILGEEDPASLDDKKRVSMVANHNKQAIRDNGFDNALESHLLARPTDLLPDSDETARARTEESERHRLTIEELTETMAPATLDECLIHYNRTNITDAGMRVMKASGSVVSESDVRVPQYDTYDPQAGDEYLPVASATQSHIIAPGENTTLISDLMMICGQQHPEYAALVVEMVDIYASGGTVTPSTGLASRTGMGMADLAEAIEEINDTMRAYVSSQMLTDE